MTINFYLLKKAIAPLISCVVGILLDTRYLFSRNVLNRSILGILFMCTFSIAFSQVNVGDYVFADVNGNGLQDDGAANGLNGVSVELWSAGPDGIINGGDDVFITSTITANGISGDPGYFGFSGVTNGTYYFKFPRQVKNYFLTNSSAGNPLLDSDVNRFSGESALFVVNGNDINEVDAGYSISFPVCPSVCEKQFIEQYSISKPEVIFDIENDTFRLPKFDASLGELLKTEIEAKADIRMFYQFENRGLAPRDIFFAYFDTTLTRGPGLGSGLLFTAQDTVINTTLPPTDNVNFSGADYITDSLFIGSFISDTALTSPIDLATFTGLDSLDYLFNAISYTVAPSSGTLYRLYLTFARVEVTIRYTYCKRTCASIGDFVWNDLNKNGIQDPNEPGLANISVSLFDISGNIVGVTQTDAFGHYTFSNIQPGQYSVGFSVPVDYTLTQAGAGGNSANDSDPDPNTGITPVFTLGESENKTDIDAGMYFQSKNTANLGNFIWYDENKNGIQETGEVGVANVTVTLYDGTTNNAIGTAVTNTDGEYYFRNLRAGTYRIGITQPQGYTLSLYNQGGDDNADSDINPTSGLTDLINLSNTDDYSWDVGLALTAPLTANVGDYVWDDLNKDGIQDAKEPGVQGITVTLFDTTNTVVAVTKTDAFGKYIFNNVEIEISPSNYRSNYYITFNVPSNYDVTIPNATADESDSDIALSGITPIFILNPGDNLLTIDAGIYRNDLVGSASIGDFVWLDKNKNGIQDTDEKGIPCITVTLLDNAGNPIALTVTDIDGYYLFPNLEAGNYVVAFSNLPFGSELTITGQGTSALDSDPNPQTGKTPVIVLAAGEQNQEVDAGIVSAVSENGNASVGDFVWYDLNFNGSQDPNEPGVAGVTVTLSNLSNTVILSTNTNGAGRYLFNGLNPDEYILTFSGIPTGYSITTKDADSNNEKDSDVDPLTLQTISFILGDGQNDLSWDAGIHNPTPTASSIGDFVWNDLNQNGIQEPNEPGVSGIGVFLYNSANEFIAATVTNDNGFYLFPDVAPGDYIIVFANLPAGFDFTTPNNPGGTEATDSDPNPLTGQTDVFTLPPATNLTDIDAGIFTSRAAVGDFVWEDTNNNGLQDVNEKGISGITVYLQNAGTTIASIVTNGNGGYYFSNLVPDNYEITFADIPLNTLITIQDAGGNAFDATDSDADPQTAMIPSFPLAPKEINLTYDIGLYGAPHSTVTGIVWFDDGDGIRQDTELPVAGVTVSLVDIVTGETLSLTVTNSDGVYFFDNVPSGTFEVIFSIPQEGLTLTITDANGNANDDKDSDVTAITPPGTYPLIATGGTITVNPGDNLAGPDAGILPSAGLKGMAWTDNNVNGVRETNDLGIRQVKVKLFASTDPNTVIRTTVTGGEGLYQFLNLTPGVSYIVKFDSIPLRSWTLQFAGSDTTKDSDVFNYFTAIDSTDKGKTPVLSPLRIGEIRPFIDAGYLRIGDIFPVVLTTFNGLLSGGDAILNWKTVTEQNSAHFIIQRSLNGFSANSVGEDIGTVTAKGNSFEEVQYQFKDVNVSALNVKTVWYRLKMVDIDGQFEYSDNVVEIRLEEENTNIYCLQYPNPATNMLSIDYQLFNAKYGEINIINALGQTVYSSSIDANTMVQTLKINTSSWARGAYSIRISSESSVLTKRLLLE